VDANRGQTNKHTKRIYFYILDNNGSAYTHHNNRWCTVCVPAGYLLSYWNRPFFPEFCSDAALDDKETYDTAVRLAGSFTGIAQVFKAVADLHGWRHIVVVSDDETESFCWYGAKPIDDVYGSDKNYTLTWLRFSSNPFHSEFDDILQQIRSRTRGFFYFVLLRYKR